jgi:two-component sensor histidine kinase
MRTHVSGAEVDHISARGPPANSAFTISIAFICTCAIFALAVIPFTANPGPVIPGITAVFVTIVFATELSTSFLLFVHFRANPHWSLLILGSAFLYSALMVVPHLLTFPGAVLADQALVGSSRQTSGYIFVSWITGFALLTFISVLFEARDSRHQFALVRVDRAVCTAVSAVSVVVLNVTLIAILLDRHLPALVKETQSWTVYSQFLIMIAIALFAASIAIVLFSIRNELFLWLAMALATDVIAIILTEVGGARYTVGWLVGRVTWIISGCVLFLYFLRQFARQQNQLVLSDRAQALLVAELDHRVKNILAEVAVVAVSTRQGNHSIDGFLRSLDGRIQSMAGAHTLLSKSGWQSVGLDALVRNQLAPYATDTNITISGTDIMLTVAEVRSVAKVLHELATNAAKYGALSIPGGHVSVSWNRKPNGDGANLMLDWQEHGGPPVKSEAQSSYGTDLIRNLIPHELGGKVDLVFAAEGVCCRIEIPIGHRSRGAVWRN